MNNNILFFLLTNALLSILMPIPLTAFPTIVVSLVEDDNQEELTTRSTGCCVAIKHKLIVQCLDVRINAIIGGSLTVDGNERIGGNLIVNNNETIDGDLTVLGTIFATITPEITNNLELIGTPESACIIFLDNTLTEKARICSSPIVGDHGVFVSVDGGATQNLRVTNSGGSTIPAPTTGIALNVTGNALASAITAAGNSTLTAPALILTGNPASDNNTDFLLAIDNTGVVRQTATTFAGFIRNNGQPGALVIGSTNATSMTFITSANNRLSIDPNGAIVIATPAAGTALTINGGGQIITAGNLLLSAGNITLPVANAAGTQGLMQFNAVAASAMRLYEFGNRNFFATNGATNTVVTGADNIGIGTTANSTLTTGNNAIGIGNNARSAATDSISIGDNISTVIGSLRVIVIGSRDSTSTGVAPSATGVDAISIGSASGIRAGSTAAGLSAISIGGADPTFAASAAAGNRAIAIGLNSTASSTNTIAIGSASGTAAGAGPLSNNTNSLAIGSGNAALAGPRSTAIATIAIGGSGGVFAGAVASANRGIAIGTNATSNSIFSIAIGSASGVAGGTATTASNNNSIAIGSANTTHPAAQCAGLSSVAIGGADATFNGASIPGARSIGIGLNANSSQTNVIVIGSASGVVGGNGPTIAAGGTDAIVIGSANGALASPTSSGLASMSIGSADGVFAGPTTAGSRAIAIGLGATGTSNSTIAIGSASGVVGGGGPAGTAGTNSISIGSANNALVAARATNTSAIAIGGANGTFAGAAASAVMGIAFGYNATASGTNAIAIGSASNSLTGIAATAASANGIAIGAAQLTVRGALAQTGAAAIAIGASDGVTAGASATGARAVSIGNGANTAQADAVILGNPASTRIRVGVGSNVPDSMLHAVGEAGVPVIRLAAGSTAITSQPVWTTPATVAVAGTPIHYNASNQLFGFTSSARYKQNIRDIADESKVLYQLNPVLYDPKEEHGESKDIPGFIAEQVFKVAAHLAILNNEGQPENIAYNALLALTIKEIQNHQQKLQEQRTILAQRAVIIDQLLRFMEQQQLKKG